MGYRNGATAEGMAETLGASPAGMGAGRARPPCACES